MLIFPVSSGSIYLLHLVRESANTAGLKIQVVCLPLIVTWKELFHKMMKYLNFSIFLTCLFEKEKSVVLTSGICSTQLKKVAYASETGRLLHTMAGGGGRDDKHHKYVTLHTMKTVGMQNLQTQDLLDEHSGNYASGLLLKATQNISWSIHIFWSYLSQLASVTKSLSWEDVTWKGVSSLSLRGLCIWSNRWDLKPSKRQKKKNVNSCHISRN